MDRNTPIDLLSGYNNTAWCEDHFIETIDKKYAMWFYNVLEHTMGAYYGHISIFYKDVELPLLSSGQVWVWYRFNDTSTFIYAQKSDCLIFRMPAYQGENIIKPDFPYLLIKPTAKLFSFIEWDFTSIYYSFSEIDKDFIEVKELNTTDLDRVSFPRKTGETINMNKLTWYELNNFDQAEEIYLNKQPL